MRNLFRYGVDRPILTWGTLILGAALIIFHHNYIWLLGVILVVISFVTIWHTLSKYQLVELVIRHCNLRTARKILDIGTGKGFFMTHVTRAAGYVAFTTGIEDQGQDQIKKARKNTRRERVSNRVNVIHGDVRHLPFPEASFSLITVMDSPGNLISNRRSNGYQQVCNEIIRVLKEYGRFLMIGNRKNVNRIYQYLNQQDGVQAKTLPNPQRWNLLHWGILTMQKND